MNKDINALKNKAIQLRKKGLSYKEIKQEINVAKSTLSLWLSAVPLKQEHRKRLYEKVSKYLAQGSFSQKERRAKEVETIIKEAGEEVAHPLPRKTLRMMGAMLYWAEGRKMKGGMELTNSDPLLILFFVKWLWEIFNISPHGLRMRLNIYPQQDEKKLKKFWSELTGIPLSNFRKSFIKPRNNLFKKNNLYYGTARIEVSKGTDNKHRIYGWIHKALSDLHPDINLIERKWKSLKEVKRPVNVYMRP